MDNDSVVEATADWLTTPLTELTFLHLLVLGVLLLLVAALFVEHLLKYWRVTNNV